MVPAVRAHRDLKPENIYIVPDAEMPDGERIKLLDFGIAKIAAGDSGVRTQANVIMGTPAYMSPEQCLGAKDVDAKTDVYALGIILFEMLAGRPPFVAERPGEFLPMHMLKPPPLLTQFVPLLPSKLVGLVHSMLAKEPTARPRMEQVAAQLQRLLAGGQAGPELAPIAPTSAAANEERPTKPAKALAKGRPSAEISDADLPVTAALRVKRPTPAAARPPGRANVDAADSGAYDPTSPGAPDFGAKLDDALDNARTTPVVSLHLADLAAQAAAAPPAAPAVPAPASAPALTGASWVPMEIVKTDYKSAPEQPPEGAPTPALAPPSREAPAVPPPPAPVARRRSPLPLVIAAVLLLAALLALLFGRSG
jgi:serine/threonine-protein kinase